MPGSQSAIITTSICLFTIMACGGLSGMLAHWQKIWIVNFYQMHSCTWQFYLLQICNKALISNVLILKYCTCTVLKYLVEIRCCTYTCTCEGFKILVLVLAISILRCTWPQACTKQYKYSWVWQLIGVIDELETSQV